MAASGISRPGSNGVHAVSAGRLQGSAFGLAAEKKRRLGGAGRMMKQENGGYEAGIPAQAYPPVASLRCRPVAESGFGKPAG